MVIQRTPCSVAEQYRYVFLIAGDIAIRYEYWMKRVIYSKAAEKSLKRMQAWRREAIGAKV